MGNCFAAAMLVGISATWACAGSAPPAEPRPAAGFALQAAAEAAPRPPSEPERLFDERVAPVLRERCTPCHFPGGEMYARLPFDREATIQRNAEAVLRRLKGEDRVAVEGWLTLRGSEASPHDRLESG